MTNPSTVSVGMRPSVQVATDLDLDVTSEVFRPTALASLALAVP